MDSETKAETSAVDTTQIHEIEKSGPKGPSSPSSISQGIENATSVDTELEKPASPLSPDHISRRVKEKAQSIDLQMDKSVSGPSSSSSPPPLSAEEISRREKEKAQFGYCMIPMEVSQDFRNMAPIDGPAAPVVDIERRYSKPVPFGKINNNSSPVGSSHSSPNQRRRDDLYADGFYTFSRLQNDRREQEKENALQRGGKAENSPQTSVNGSNGGSPRQAESFRHNEVYGRYNRGERAPFSSRGHRSSNFSINGYNRCKTNRIEPVQNRGRNLGDCQTNDQGLADWANTRPHFVNNNIYNNPITIEAPEVQQTETWPNMTLKDIQKMLKESMFQVMKRRPHTTQRDWDYVLRNLRKDCGDFEVFFQQKLKEGKKLAEAKMKEPIVKQAQLIQDTAVYDQIKADEVKFEDHLPESNIVEVAAQVNQDDIIKGDELKLHESVTETKIIEEPTQVNQDDKIIEDATNIIQIESVANEDLTRAEPVWEIEIIDITGTGENMTAAESTGEEPVWEIAFIDQASRVDKTVAEEDINEDEGKLDEVVTETEVAKPVISVAEEDINEDEGKLDEVVTETEVAKPVIPVAEEDINEDKGKLDVVVTETDVAKPAIPVAGEDINEDEVKFDKTVVEAEVAKQEIQVAEEDINEDEVKLDDAVVEAEVARQEIQVAEENINEDEVKLDDAVEAKVLEAVTVDNGLKTQEVKVEECVEEEEPSVESNLYVYNVPEETQEVDNKPNPVVRQVVDPLEGVFLFDFYM